MILSLFIPDHIYAYYLFPVRIVGIEITRQGLFASVVVLKGKSRIVEATFQESFTDAPFDAQVIEALKGLKLKLGSYSKIYCLVPSSQIIFKDISLPFIGGKKIKMVIPFEVESQLPFGLEEGAIDCIITGVDARGERTDVLVAAVKQDLISRYASYFLEAGLPLDKLSIDIFELYGLYQTGEKKSDDQVVALITIGRNETTVGLIIDGRLTYVRTITKAISSTQSTTDTLTPLLEEINLTIDTALQRLAPARSTSQIIITGIATEQDIVQMRSFFMASHELPVEIITFDKLTEHKIVSSKLPSVPGEYISSIALAISPEKTEDFTLLQTVARQKEDRYLTLQLLSIAIITGTLLISFSLYSFFRVRTLKKAYAASEKEAIGELKKQFKITVHQARRLDLANKAAQAELKKQETAWRRISPENRYLYLRYLAQLTKCINMKESQLDLDSIIVKDDTIKLYGKVPGYQQLTKLQEQLECPLFKKIPKLQAFNFKSEPITLTVNPEAL